MPCYKKSPIIEAVCEIRFAESKDSDMTVVGHLQDKIKDTFPIKQNNNVQITLPADSPLRFVTEQRVQFFTPDQLYTIGASPTVVSISRLEPYTSWEDYRAYIKIGLDAYVEASPTNEIFRAGLRYINQFDIPLATVNIHEWTGFTAPDIHGVDEADYPITVFKMLAEFPRSGGRDLVRLQFASVPSAYVQHNRFILDIEHCLVLPGALESVDFMAWVDEAHESVETYFEGTIKDRLRELFEPDAK